MECLEAVEIGSRLDEEHKRSTLQKHMILSPCVEISWLTVYQPEMRSARKHTWTLTHSCYALMGGFAMDVDDDVLRPYIA